MNRFESSTPRVATAIASVFMTAITFGLLVLVPAALESGGEGMRAQATNGIPPSATERIVIAAGVDTHRQT